MNRGVLLVNLGSPDSTSVGDVRRYLNEFLMDARVIDSPWPLRRLIVGMILITPPETIRRGLSQNLDGRGFTAHRHKPPCPDEAAGTRHPAGRPGDAIPESFHYERDPRAGGAEN